MARVARVATRAVRWCEWPRRVRRRRCGRALPGVLAQGELGDLHTKVRCVAPFCRGGHCAPGQARHGSFTAALAGKSRCHLSCCGACVGTGFAVAKCGFLRSLSLGHRLVLLAWCCWCLRDRGLTRPEGSSMAVGRAARGRHRKCTCCGFPDRHESGVRGFEPVRRQTGGRVPGEPDPPGGAPAWRARPRAGEGMPVVCTVGCCCPPVRGRARVHIRALCPRDSRAARLVCAVQLRCSSRRDVRTARRGRLRDRLPRWWLRARLARDFGNLRDHLRASTPRVAAGRAFICCITPCWVPVPTATTSSSRLP